MLQTMLLSQGVQLTQEETSTQSLKDRLGMLSLPAKSKVFFFLRAQYFTETSVV